MNIKSIYVTPTAFKYLKLSYWQYNLMKNYPVQPGNRSWNANVQRWGWSDDVVHHLVSEKIPMMLESKKTKNLSDSQKKTWVVNVFAKFAGDRVTLHSKWEHIAAPSTNIHNPVEKS